MGKYCAGPPSLKRRGNHLRWLERGLRHRIAEMKEIGPLFQKNERDFIFSNFSGRGFFPPVCLIYRWKGAMSALSSKCVSISAQPVSFSVRRGRPRPYYGAFSTGKPASIGDTSGIATNKPAGDAKSKSAMGCRFHGVSWRGSDCVKSSGAIRNIYLTVFL